MPDAILTASHSPLNDLSPVHAFQFVAAVLLLAVVLPLARHLRDEYLSFVALGPGGTPTTLAGFVRVKVLSLFALRDPYVPASHIPKRFQGSRGYLVNGLPERRRPRPVTKGIAPHRQVTQRAPPALYAQLALAIENLAASSDSHFRLGTSCFEKNGTALFSRSPTKRTCGGEIVHAHPSDGSMHLTLHPADARRVLEAGWGERHPLARGGWWERFVPGGFVMVYAPVEEGEVGIVMEVVRAGAWFVNGGEGVEGGGEGEGRRDSGYASEEEGIAEGGVGRSVEDGGSS
ncbi:hypothetical protein LTR91_014556 [Friedmanniomyces endolithicus]|uniref:Luciferase domain-containing protein n=1 Tax=Friedmanniomyces endolithicus TaxID=329885 RepID=A0AAN6KBU3_9PEZI|nr:hypothetical protein LTR57_015579 [Friedmanniomyces endolithicus]KAK0970131.1 hypothetical protein LTS01_015949 [Friedmanniomyces endolithicus]KAK0974010.1 hypothetical protein LTR91_014556 [Friedmanniomyces endolithicus]KAK1038590.1 hypothetical protein LTS16_011897 [Friedmanniomyces endolithicus]